MMMMMMMIMIIMMTKMMMINIASYMYMRNDNQVLMIRMMRIVEIIMSDD